MGKPALKLVAPAGAGGCDHADRLIAGGTPPGEAFRAAGVSPSAYYRWRTHNIRYVFFYGSLRRGQPGYIELSLDKYLKYHAVDSVPGKLFDLGKYPGMKLANRRLR